MLSIVEGKGWRGVGELCEAGLPTVASLAPDEGGVLLGISRRGPEQGLLPLLDPDMSISQGYSGTHDFGGGLLNVSKGYDS